MVLAQMANPPLPSPRTEHDLAPSYFLHWGWINARAQRSRHQLRPKTYSDRPSICVQPHFKQVQRVLETRVEIIFVGADWSAEHDDEIRRNRIQRRDVINTAIGVAD